jgi:hypothetical protein
VLAHQPREHRPHALVEPPLLQRRLLAQGAERALGGRALGGRGRGLGGRGGRDGEGERRGDEGVTAEGAAGDGGRTWRHWRGGSGIARGGVVAGRRAPE